jgi:hypothetical protein
MATERFNKRSSTDSQTSPPISPSGVHLKRLPTVAIAPSQSLSDEAGQGASRFERAAAFSECRRYRYRLWRSWGDPSNRLLVVALNPSTADEAVDDATIRRCVGFALRWGFGALDVVNLFAWRSTDPVGLLGVASPVGDGNDESIVGACASASRIVLAWGSHTKSGALRDMVAARGARARAMVVASVPGDIEVGTFGRNKDGQPKHPLYLRGATAFVPGAPGTRATD